MFLFLLLFTNWSLHCCPKVPFLLISIDRQGSKLPPIADISDLILEISLKPPGPSPSPAQCKYRQGSQKEERLGWVNLSHQPRNRPAWEPNPAKSQISNLVFFLLHDIFLPPLPLSILTSSNRRYVLV
jgi:hypothetical protein